MQAVFDQVMSQDRHPDYLDPGAERVGGNEGQHPASMQNRLPEAARFIDATADDEMGLMFRVAVLRAPRRAELCGFRWTDTDLGVPNSDPETGEQRMGAVLGVERPIIQLGGKLRESRAKTKLGQRRIFVDYESAELLRRHYRAQVAAATVRRGLAGQRSGVLPS